MHYGGSSFTFTASSSHVVSVSVDGAMTIGGKLLLLLADGVIIRDDFPFTVLPLDAKIQQTKQAITFQTDRRFTASARRPTRFTDAAIAREGGITWGGNENVSW